MGPDACHDTLMTHLPPETECLATPLGSSHRLPLAAIETPASVHPRVSPEEKYSLFNWFSDLLFLKQVPSSMSQFISFIIFY